MKRPKIPYSQSAFGFTVNPILWSIQYQPNKRQEFEQHYKPDNAT